MNIFDSNIDKQASEATSGLIGKVIAMLRGHPEVIRALEIDQADLEGNRAALVEQIKSLREDGSNRLDLLKSSAELAYKAVLEIEPAYERRVSVWKAARDTYAVAAYSDKVEEDRLLTQLEACADPAIDETIAALRELLSLHFENGAVHVVEKDSNINESTGARTTTFLSDAAARENRRAALIAAINSAIAMKRDVEQEGIRERLAALVAGIPSGVELVEVTVRN